MDVKALIEERVKLWGENNALLDANAKGLNAEQQAEYDKRSARMNDIRASLEREELHRAEEKALGESRGRKTETEVRTGAAASAVAGVDGPPEEDRDLALRAWALGGARASSEQLEAAQRCGIRPGQDLEVRYRIRRGADGRLETRTLAVATATQGGASIPNEMMRAYLEVQKWFGNIRSVGEVIQTETGATLPWPTMDDTANSGEIIGENSAVTTTVDPTFGVVNLGAFKFSSKAVIVPVELLQDSAINLAQYLGNALGRRIGRIQNNKFTVGAGTTEPAGIVTRAGGGKTCSATNAITADEILDLQHAVDVAYRTPNAGYMLHDLTAAYVRKLKDGNSRYIWEPSMQLGQADRLWGAPCYINNDMVSTIATGNKVMLYGDPFYYKVRDAGPVVMVRAGEIYILSHQVAFLAFQRSDGNLMDTTAVKYLKLA